MPHRRQLGIDWTRYRSRLGAVSDAELAEEIGCTATAVWKERQKHGVPRFIPDTIRLGLLTRRFGRVLRTSVVRVMFDSHRCANRYLAAATDGDDAPLVARGRTRSRRFIALPAGVTRADLEAVPPELVDLLERALEAEHDRDLIAAGLDGLDVDLDEVRAAGAERLAEFG